MIANRAWLYPENFSFGEVAPEKPIHMTMDTQNVGKEPALDVLFGDKHHISSGVVQANPANQFSY